MYVEISAEGLQNRNDEMKNKTYFFVSNCLAERLSMKFKKMTMQSLIFIFFMKDFI